MPRFHTLLIMLLLSVLAAACTTTQELRPERYSATLDGDATRTLDPGAVPVLDVRTSVGDITIQGDGAADSVYIAYTTTAYGTSQEDAEEELDDVRVRIGRDGDTITVDALQSPGDNQRTNRVDLAITVPDRAGLTVVTTLGDITITDVTAEGPLTVRTLTGNTTLTRVSVPAGMTLDGGSGDVVFDGELGDSGEVVLSANVGSLTVTLPPETVARVEARAAVGAVTVEGFAVARDEAGTAVPGAGGQFAGVIGAGEPEMVLRLDVTIGDIVVRAQ